MRQIASVPSTYLSAKSSQQNCRLLASVGAVVAPRTTQRDANRDGLMTTTAGDQTDKILLLVAHGAWPCPDV
jgi:hypothetical protein